MSFTIICLACPAAASAQAQVMPAVDYTFGGQVGFSVTLPPDQAVESVQVLFRNLGDAETLSGQMALNGSQATYIHDLIDQPLRPFSTVEYWFVITPPEGAPVTTEVNTFQYVDNRLQWQTVEDEQFRVHWYEGETSFGQSVLEAARAGAERAQSLMPVGVVEPIDIYVYASGKELQSTLRLGGLNWVAGHADPDLNLMLVSLPPGPDQNRETERQIPHELMHILLYQAVSTGYQNLPTWFKEGLASANELRPNPDYFLILESAIEDDALISLAQLCESFPKDSSVYLAYAESDSFVRYLHQEYGAGGLGELLQSYAGGASCELGSVTALGLPLERLESEWRRQELGEYALLSALMNMLPWLLVMGIVILVPLSMVLVNLRKKSTRKEAKVSYGRETT
jgi:hypothetical protein